MNEKKTNSGVLSSACLRGISSTFVGYHDFFQKQIPYIRFLTAVDRKQYEKRLALSLHEIFGLAGGWWMVVERGRITRKRQAKTFLRQIKNKLSLRV